MLNAGRRILHPFTNFLCHLSAAIFYDAICDDIKWRLNPYHRQAAEQLTNLKDKHVGERCFIIGNGPSLNRTDLSKLSNEYTFGLNKIYLLFDTIDFCPTYYVCVNPLVIEQHWHEIAKVPTVKFINLVGTDYLSMVNDVIFLRTIDREPKFSTNPGYGVWAGGTVTYCAMQLAYYMGFSEVVLIGVDHYFSSQGKPNKTVVSKGPDSDHFSPDYFGKGVKWQLPDLETSEISYRLAKVAFEKNGRKIIDATVGGHLDIFPKVSYDSLFDKSL